MRSKRKPTFTAAYLREILDYDPDTGIFRWRVKVAQRVRVGDIAGCLHHGYRDISIDHKQWPAHCLAWYYFYGIWPRGDIDHEDTIKDHNWIDNLRPATRSQNCANSRRRNNSSGYKGVSYNQYGKWMARITKDGTLIYIGNFSAPEAAHSAYVAKAKELFGAFSNAG